MPPDLPSNSDLWCLLARPPTTSYCPSTFQSINSPARSHVKRTAKNTRNIYFFGFYYSAHLNLCGDTVVLSGIRLLEGIHECLSKLTCFSYTCQLFLKYRREIFILGVLGFL